MLKPKPKSDKASLAERRRRAVEQRLGGSPYEAIAASLGYASASGAYEAVKAGLADALREPARDLRQVELRRLDRLTESVWPLAIAGDLDALDRVLKLMGRRAALLGLDAPAKLAVHAEARPPRRLTIPGADPRIETEPTDDGPGPIDPG